MNEVNNIKETISNLPETPGVYQFYDKNDKIIYVGKAKNLKKRVASYFNKNHPVYKTKLLVNKITKIECIVVDNESDALLLENNLIKKLQPAFNVLLKDDKTYPWIVIKNEDFPRVFYTRQKNEDGSIYFGPFTSVYMVKTLLSLIKQLYPLRTCNHKLTPQNIQSGKFSVCLEYHLGNCLGPCEGKVSKENYQDFIDSAHSIIKGDIHIIQKYLRANMKKAASDYDFESAAKYKEKIEIIENYQSKSTIVSKTITNIDVFAISLDVNSAYVNYLKVQKGAVIQAHTIELRKRLDETKEDLLLMAIVEIRNSLQSNNKEVVVPFMLNYSLNNVKWVVPKRGDKLKLLELSERNAKFYMLEKHKHIEKTNPEKHINRKLQSLKSDLLLKYLPRHIECFDISGIQGTNVVGSCVVFRDTKPSKKEYRHYNIKTVQGQDDFASMKEVVFRRYSKLIEEKQELPNLIIIDGGKGQLNAAIESLKKLDIYGEIAIIGIAKKLEEIFYPKDPLPLYLDKTSESLKIIQHARNEAHRFVISFHKQKRSSSFLKSELESISGIGDKTIKNLLNHFKSVEKIKNAPLTDLEKIIGKHKASILKTGLRKD